MEFPPVGAYSKILAASTTSNESALPSAPPIIRSSTASVSTIKGSALTSAGTASSVIAAEHVGKIDPSYATTTTYDSKLAPGGFDTSLYGSISNNPWSLQQMATGRLFPGNPYGNGADAYMGDVAGAGMPHSADGGLNPYSTPLCGVPPSDSVYSSMAANWTQYGYLPTSTFDENQLGAGRLSSLYGHVSDSALYNMQRGTDVMSSSSLLTTDASAAQLALPGIGTHLNSGTIDLCQGPSLLSHPTSNLDYLQRGLQPQHSTPLFPDASMVIQPNGSIPVSYFHHDKEEEQQQQQLYGLSGTNHQHQQQILDLANSAYHHQPPLISVGGHLQHPPLTSSTPMLNTDGSCSIGPFPVPPPSSQTTVATTGNSTSTPATTRGRSANGRRRAKSSATASSSRLYPTVASKDPDVLPHSSGAPPPLATIESRDCIAVTAEKGEVMTPGMACGGRGKPGRPGRSCSSYNNSDDDSFSVEGKEVERRTANNTRERIRVRDINAAFKELAKLCAQHIPNTEERGLTKLGTLLKAVDLIPTLEAKVRERNMDPKCANSMMNLRRDNSQSIVDNSHQSFGSSCSSS